MTYNEEIIAMLERVMAILERGHLAAYGGALHVCGQRKKPVAGYLYDGTALNVHEIRLHEPKAVEYATLRGAVAVVAGHKSTHEGSVVMALQRAFDLTRQYDSNDLYRAQFDDVLAWSDATRPTPTGLRPNGVYVGTEFCPTADRGNCVGLVLMALREHRAVGVTT